MPGYAFLYVRYMSAICPGCSRPPRPQHAGEAARGGSAFMEGVRRAGRPCTWGHAARHSTAQESRSDCRLGGIHLRSAQKTHPRDRRSGLGHPFSTQARLHFRQKKHPKSGKNPSVNTRMINKTCPQGAFLEAFGGKPGGPMLCLDGQMQPRREKIEAP